MRLSIAGNLYNRGLTRALSAPDGRTVNLGGGLYPLPFGQQVAVQMPPDALRWEGRTLFGFVPVAECGCAGCGSAIATAASAHRSPPARVHRTTATICSDQTSASR